MIVKLISSSSFIQGFPNHLGNNKTLQQEQQH